MSSSIPFNPELEDIDRSNQVVIITTVFTVLIILATAVRIGTKLACRVKFQMDDYLIVLSLGFNLAGSALEYRAVDAGFGRHLQFLTREQERTFNMLSQYAIVTACFALWSVKISVCFFILALIRGTHKRLKWFIYALIAITTASSLCQLLLWGLQAKPLEKLWKPEVSGTVASKRTLVISIIVFTVIYSISDLLYALAPIYFLAQVRVTLQKKLVILALTGSGLLVFAVSIIRLCFVRDFFDPDSTWALKNVYICTIIERNLASIIADLPAMSLFARQLRKKITTFASTHWTGGTNMNKTGTLASRLNGRFTSGSKKYDEVGSFGSRQDQSSFRLNDLENQTFEDSSKHARDNNSKFFQETFTIEGSDKEIPLRNIPLYPEAVVKKDSKAIQVQTDINVRYEASEEQHVR